jgi:hypothetical protein
LEQQPRNGRPHWLKDGDAEALQPLLAAGETWREAGDVDRAFGHTGPSADHEPIHLETPGWLGRRWAAGTRTPLRRVVFFTLLSPLALLAALDSLSLDGWLERLIGGRTCTGPRGSLARRAEHAFNRLASGANMLVVSDRRLLLVRRALWRRDDRFSVVETVDLADVAGARVRPRGLLRRRVEVRFTDGSTIVLALPTFRAPRPKRVVAALTR